MLGLESLGKLLLVFGGVLLLLGAVLIIAGKLPYIGRLPGDIFFSRGNLNVYIPLATMIIVSIILTILVNVIIRIVR